jgi:hypothetical protein
MPEYYKNITHFYNLLTNFLLPNVLFSINFTFQLMKNGNDYLSVIICSTN